MVGERRRGGPTRMARKPESAQDRRHTLSRSSGPRTPSRASQAPRGRPRAAKAAPTPLGTAWEPSVVRSRHRTSWASRARGGAGVAGGGGRGGGAPHPGPSRRVLAHPGGVRSPQFLGRWFTSGLASNSSWFREKKKVLSMCVSVVAPSADGGLNLTSTFLRWDGWASGVQSSPPHGHRPGTALGLTPGPFGGLPTGKSSVRHGPCCCGRREPRAATAIPVPVSGAPLETPSWPWAGETRLPQQSMGRAGGHSTGVS